MCITDTSQPAEQILGSPALPPDQMAHVLGLRGLLACGLLLHCLQKRHAVEFGVNRCWAALHIDPQLFACVATAALFCAVSLSVFQAVLIMSAGLPQHASVSQYHIAQQTHLLSAASSPSQKLQYCSPH